MYLKKTFYIIVLILLPLTLIGCETSNNKQLKTLSYNQTLNTENKNNNTIPQLSEFSNEVLKDEKNKKLVVGLMLPLTGENYIIGRSLLNAAQLALDKTNQKNIVFKIIDTGNEKDLLKNLYTILNDDLNIIIGPVFTEKINQVKEIIKSENIPIISLSNNSDLEGNGVFVFGLTLEDEINALLNYSLNNDLSKYAVIIPDNEYGKRIKNEIENFKVKDTSLVFKYVFYNSKSPDFYGISKTVSDYEERRIKLENEIELLEKDSSENASKKLKKLKKLDTYGELDFQAILILTQNFDELSKLSSILPYYDVDPKEIQYMGNSIWSKDLSLKEPGLDGGYFTTFNIDYQRNFEEEYFNIFAHKPHALASLTYDLVGLISKLHLNSNFFTIEQLYVDAGFVGINGWFKINRNGKVFRQLSIYKIRNQKFVSLN